MKLKFKGITPKASTIYRGDNLEILRALPHSFVDLIYADPPFFSQKNYQGSEKMKNSENSRGVSAIEGFEDTKFYFEKQTQTGAKGLMAYLEWMKIRLVELHRLLKPTGGLYLHLDHHAVHYVKVILDEIFGYENFRNEIVWQRKIGSNATGVARSWPNNSDYVLFYSKGKDYTFNPQYVNDRQDLPASITKMYRRDDQDGKGLYQLGPLEAPSDSPTLKFEFKGVRPPKKGWRWNKARMEKAYQEGLLHIYEDKSSIRQKMHLSKRKGALVESIWTDIRCVQGGANEYQGWPTQKPVALLERIIRASSNPGDLILDCFAGCGSAMHAAHLSNRNWIGIEISQAAARVSQRRMAALKASVTVIDEKDIWPLSKPTSKKRSA